MCSGEVGVGFIAGKPTERAILESLETSSCSLGEWACPRWGRGAAPGSCMHRLRNQTTPCASMASATLTNPAMLAPLT